MGGHLSFKVRTWHLIHNPPTPLLVHPTFREGAPHQSLIFFPDHFPVLGAAAASDLADSSAASDLADSSAAAAALGFHHPNSLSASSSYFPRLPTLSNALQGPQVIFEILTLLTPLTMEMQSSPVPITQSVIAGRRGGEVEVVVSVPGTLSGVAAATNAAHQGVHPIVGVELRRRGGERVGVVKPQRGGGGGVGEVGGGGGAEDGEVVEEEDE
ncbi:hypothetical protein Scep_004692 [Stephania cephalantha]|uniref:Uncharacterized protein n=1 Tax=Stephania cephalantha TaxID=152367 RepID=A0AAP0KUB7_9MAGN